MSLALVQAQIKNLDAQLQNLEYYVKENFEDPEKKLLEFLSFINSARNGLHQAGIQLTKMKMKG